MENHKTICKIKTLIENGRTEIAADLLLTLTKSSTKFEFFLDETVLVKNRIESLKRQDIIGAISFSEKNIEGARISNALLSLVMDIEKEIGLEPDIQTISLEKEENLSTHTTTATQPTKPISFFPFSRVFIFSFLGLIAISLFIYYCQKEASKSATPSVFTVSIEAFKDEQHRTFTEGGIILQLKDFPQKKMGLDVSGKFVMNDFPAKALKNKAPFQLVDSTFYTIMQQEVGTNDDLKTIKLIIQPKTITYQGKIINSNGQPVKNAIIEIGNGIAQAQTDEQGNYTVSLPKKNMGNTLNIMIRKDNKVLMDEPNWINEKVLSSLKVF